MENLYKTPQLFDIFYNPDNEAPLVNHYKGVFGDKPIKTIFDCSIGTGNLTFALADMGYEISGSDISTEMLAEAREKALKRNININLYQSDFRVVDQVTNEKFDCVMSTGNSLAHVNNEDVRKTLASMAKMVKTDGYLYFDCRNWGLILEKQERFIVYPPVIKGPDERTNVVFVVDYLKEEQVRFNMLYTFEKNNRIVGKEIRPVEYYPIKHEVMVDTLKELGFVDFEVINFINHAVTDIKEMGWYTMICRKAI